MKILSKLVVALSILALVPGVGHCQQVDGRVRSLREQFALINTEAVARGIDDLARTYPNTYDAARHRADLAAFEAKQDEIKRILDSGDQVKLDEADALIQGVRMALITNPLLDSDSILMVRRNMGDVARRDMRGRLGLISLNSHIHVTIGRGGWNDEIVSLSGLRDKPKVETLYKPDRDVIVRDIDLDFSAGRMLFSSLDERRKWAVYEVGVDGKGLKQISPKDYPDVDWFDACYLPDGRIIMLSTASYQALPCENGSRPMAETYLFDPKTGSIRQLTFEQDSDYTPSITNDGRVLYTRWEYSDIMHYYSRILMTMNPDGTSQLPLYGSGSYYPTALLQARVIPGDKHKVVGIISGHHDMSEIGRMVIFDPSLSRKYPFKFTPKEKVWGPEGSFLRIPTEVLSAEQSGCVQEIPGWGKPVEGDVCDQQVGNQFERGKPYFVYPWPLNDKYFLVTAKPKPDSLWGVYLVDVFDNMTLLAESEGAAMMEPVMLQKRTRPANIPDRIKPGATTATVHIADIYKGPGLAGIPRGSVKALRVFAYHFNYVGTGGHESLGVEAGWDIKRVLGTVAVEDDGSACFDIPANTPISLQPLDNDGAALQLMRSWLVGMPGERVSCVGCHEDNRSSVPSARAIADKNPPRKLKPWYGAARPFGFEHEVYPVVQKYCVGCHDGGERAGAHKAPAMRDSNQAYKAIHPFVRRPGPESELEMLNPMEYHVSTSPLIQMLKKGHHGVKLDREAIDRLYTWIDLNAPYKGKWSPGDFEGRPQKERRIELAKLFANVDASPEDEYDRVAAEIKSRPAPEFVWPEPVAAMKRDELSVPAAAHSVAEPNRREIELPNGQKMTFVRVPAGRFVMGSYDGFADENPRAIVDVKKSFWMSECEVTNAQYAAFDPKHDTRYIDEHGKDHNFPGYIANHPNQPVARLAWTRAMAFCEWLSKSKGVKANLPTEAQWEWAARAGTASQFFYGGLDDDFSPWANLAGRETRWNKVGFDGGPIIQRRHPYPPEMNFPLHEERFEDKWFVVDYVAQYQANPWGLKDMVGNVSEWTRSSYRAYPYKDGDGRNAGTTTEMKVARGGSWASRPREAGSSVRFAYLPYQAVHDVGFRVIIEE